MAKNAVNYYKIDPWKIIEDGFDPKWGRVSESIFSLGNEYMGIRGIFDECYSGDQLVGSYYNGVYEEKPITYAEHFKGMSERCCFMVNANNWLYTRIYINGRELDLSVCPFTEYRRELDLKTGILTRSFLHDGILFSFERFVSMTDRTLGAQRMTVRSLKFTGEIRVETGCDFTPIHEEEQKNFWIEIQRDSTAILVSTLSSHQRVYSQYAVNQPLKSLRSNDKMVVSEVRLNLRPGQTEVVDKLVYNAVEKDRSITDRQLWVNRAKQAENVLSKGYEYYRKRHIAYWEEVWKHADVQIEGDEANQQGIRFSIFQLYQTYHGEDGRLNVGAKGLTGEKYSGWTFWDTETYCLPFYIFNNPEAARSLIMFRYNTLPQARARAIEQDTKGSCYPMVTIDGTESCGVWQHGNLEIHVTAGVAYAVWNYVHCTGDREFLYQYGAEILVEVSRYFASRGGWSPLTGEFGLYGVMGPDEFHMMVHNNTYTNYMVQKMFRYTLETLKEMETAAPDRMPRLEPGEREEWKRMADHMRILYNEKTGLYEQHDGYFDLPETDMNRIQPDQIPVYKFWAYDSIFRCNMLKQPDVVLMQFFFSQDFDLASKRANFDFYEKRCSHESSLSPAIHSIIAAEIGYEDKAVDFARYAWRLDLDNYNRNTDQGLHVTSMAAGWMNIVYGFGGMRSDGATLIFRPMCPAGWQGYSFRLLYQGNLIEVCVQDGQVSFTSSGESTVSVYDHKVTLDQTPRFFSLETHSEVPLVAEACVACG